MSLSREFVVSVECVKVKKKSFKNKSTYFRLSVKYSGDAGEVRRDRLYAAVYDFRKNIEELVSNKFGDAAATDESMKIPPLRECKWFEKGFLQVTQEEKRKSIQDLFQRVLSLPPVISRSRDVQDFFILEWSPNSPQAEAPSETTPCILPEKKTSDSSTIGSASMRFPEPPQHNNVISICDHYEELPMPECDEYDSLALNEFGQGGGGKGKGGGGGGVTVVKNDRKLSEIVDQPYWAVKSYKQCRSGEVNLEQGAVVNVIQCEMSGWWFVHVEDTDEQGWAPASCLLPKNRQNEQPLMLPGVQLQEKYQTARDCEGRRPDEISYKAGESVEVIEMSMDGWWKIRCHGAVGLTPVGYLRPVSKSEPECIYDFTGINRKLTPPPRRKPEESVDELYARVEEIQERKKQQTTAKPKPKLKENVICGYSEITFEETPPSESCIYEEVTEYQNTSTPRHVNNENLFVSPPVKPSDVTTHYMPSHDVMKALKLPSKKPSLEEKNDFRKPLPKRPSFEADHKPLQKKNSPGDSEKFCARKGSFEKEEFASFPRRPSIDKEANIESDNRGVSPKSRQALEAVQPRPGAGSKPSISPPLISSSQASPHEISSSESSASTKVFDFATQEISASNSLSCSQTASLSLNLSDQPPKTSTSTSTSATASNQSKTFKDELQNHVLKVVPTPSPTYRPPHATSLPDSSAVKMQQSISTTGTSNIRPAFKPKPVAVSAKLLPSPTVPPKFNGPAQGFDAFPVGGGGGGPPRPDKAPIVNGQAKGSNFIRSNTVPAVGREAKEEEAKIQAAREQIVAELASSAAVASKPGTPISTKSQTGQIKAQIAGFTAKKPPPKPNLTNDVCNPASSPAIFPLKPAIPTGAIVPLKPVVLSANKTPIPPTSQSSLRPTVPQPPPPKTAAASITPPVKTVVGKPTAVVIATSKPASGLVRPGVGGSATIGVASGLAFKSESGSGGCINHIKRTGSPVSDLEIITARITGAVLKEQPKRPNINDTEDQDWMTPVIAEPLNELSPISSVTREVCEMLLLKSGLQQQFVLRESSTKLGHYAISVLFDERVHHVPIERTTAGKYHIGSFDFDTLEKVVNYYRETTLCMSGDGKEIMLGEPFIIQA